MSASWKAAALSSAGVLALAGVMLLISPAPAEAQCGSSASSCKNCHEVQAQDPVNADGDWHVSHAFGDFCEFCHGGNVQAVDAEAAHQGMVEPLADPKTSCGACHPSDAHDLAVTYGVTLGVAVGAGQLPAAAPSDAPAAATVASTATAIPAAELVDYNAIYAETAGGPTPIGGDAILGVLIAALVVGGGGYVFWNERRRRARLSGAAEAAAVTSAAERTPAAEPVSLADAIAALDPSGRRALEQILRDPQTASEMLRRLARLDPDLIRTLRALDGETRALLLALTSDEERR
jgi:hypothetical protein